MKLLTRQKIIENTILNRCKKAEKPSFENHFKLRKYWPKINSLILQKP